MLSSSTNVMHTIPTELSAHIQRKYSCIKSGFRRVAVRFQVVLPVGFPGAKTISMGNGGGDGSVLIYTVLRRALSGRMR